MANPTLKKDALFDDDYNVFIEIFKLFNNGLGTPHISLLKAQSVLVNISPHSRYNDNEHLRPECPSL